MYVVAACDEAVVPGKPFGPYFATG